MATKKIYLDFQIFDLCSKDMNFKSKIIDMEDSICFCSTAHLEELFRAEKNAQSECNRKSSQGIMAAIEEICTKGVLNPSTQGICLKNESIDDCLQRIRKYDTTEIIQENAKALKQLHIAPPGFSKKYHQADEKWKAIWEESCIQSDIQVLNEHALSHEQKSLLFAQLKERYGMEQAVKQLSILSQSQCNVSFACYRDIEQFYVKTEYVIEQLARILSRNAYFRDSKIRQVNSGEYDISHMIYGLYCDYFITQDDNLRNRALAIYYYLQAPTRVLSINDYLKLKES